MNKELFFFIFLSLLITSCSRDNETDSSNKFDIAISDISSNSIAISYKIQSSDSDNYLICSQSENFDIKNFDIKIPINDKEGIVNFKNLSPNKKYYIKGWSSSHYSNTVSANTAEIKFSMTADKNLGLNPDSGNFIFLMYSELDPTKTYLYFITRQIQQYTIQTKKIQLHKIDLNGNVIWSRLIQDSSSPSLNIHNNGHKIQFLSDNNIAVITGKSNQKATIITKINPDSGNEIWKKEFPFIDADGYQSTSIFGYSYQNNLMKIITGPGDWHNSEEIFVNNDGKIISQRTIIQNSNNQAVMNGKYMTDGSIISIAKQNQYPQNGTWTYEGCIRKFDFTNATSNTLWSKYYGDYGGDDGFDNYLIKDNHFYIDGFYGGKSGFDDKMHWVLKTDFDGNVVWQNKLPIKKHFIYSGLDFFSDNQNNLYSLMNEMYAPTFPQYNIITLTKFDAIGNFIWEWSDAKGYNTDSFIANRAFEINDNQFLIIGDRSTNQTGVGDIRFLKINVE